MTKDDAIGHAAEVLAASNHAVVLTGAGHSTPSGIPDFRSPGSGLWSQADPMEVGSIFGFRRRPEAFYEWIRPLARKMMEAEPNPAHLAVAELERAGIVKAVITQNIDGLHQRAGSSKVLELHGTVERATCTRCGCETAMADMWHAFVATGDMPLCPNCRGLLKPNVVLFGELLPVDVLSEAEAEARLCDVMIVAGSSLEVYPAADLPRQALRHGARLIIVNYEPTAIDAQATTVIHDDVAAALPQLASRVKAIRGSDPP